VRSKIRGVQPKIVFDVECDPQHRKKSLKQKVEVANRSVQWYMKRYPDKGELALIDEEFYEMCREEFSFNRNLLAAMNYLFLGLWADERNFDYLYEAEEKAKESDDPGKLLSIITFVDKRIKSIEDNFKLKEFYQKKAEEREWKKQATSVEAIKDPLAIKAKK